MSDVVLPAAYTRYADALLHRAASSRRLRRGQPPDPLAGLRVDDDGLRVLLRELPAAAASDGTQVADSESAEPAESAESAESAGSSNAEALARLDAAHAGVIEASRAHLHAALGDDSRFGALVRRCWLDQTEAELLAVLVAVEIDPGRQRLAGYLNDDVTLGWLTPHSLEQLFPETSTPGPRDVLRAAGPGGGLRRARLLMPPDGRPFGATPIQLAPGVLWWLAGDASEPADLPPGVEILRVPGWGDQYLVVASGPDRTRRLQAVVAATPAEGFLLTSPARTSREWDALIRYASLEGLAVVLDVDDDLPPEARTHVERATQLAWAISSATDLPVSALPRRSWTSLPVMPPTATTSEVSAVFGEHELPPVTLTADQLHAISIAASAMGGDVSAALRRTATGAIEQLSTRLVPTRGWDDLVLPERQSAQVREVAQRTRLRKQVYGDWAFTPEPSTGVIAMFTGPPGTGKTLAAEVIAGSLGLDLYRVDLSQIVNKYIGETEKQLARVFAAAEMSPVVLFFDEADALLGRRSAVSDSHDRYANIEVAYLLQRIERYNGVVVLASNLAKNIDEAFIRRIHISVDFPMPGAGERRRMWSRAFPTSAPISELDLDQIADKFAVSGASIRNAAITAAFLAAEAGTPISMDAVVEGIRREMHKSGHYVRDDVM